MKKLKIALIHNRKPVSKNPHLPADYYSECDSSKTIELISAALRSGGHKVFPVEADKKLPAWLKKHPVDLAFNMAEGFHGESREARVPALLELLEIPYTGSSVLALALAMDKARSKQIFRYAGVPTPNFQLFHHIDEPVDSRLKYPLIVKPNREGSAKGISAASVVHSEKGLRVQVRHVLETYGQEALAEEFIEGMELTVGILGEEQVLPVLEIDFSPCQGSGETFYSWRMKEYQGNKKLKLNPNFWCPARLDPAVTQAVQAVAWKAAKALGTRDVVRVDIRLSTDGIPFVLEVNPLPGLDPTESNLPIMTRAAGLSYESFILRLVNLALKRALSSIPSSTKKVPSVGSPRATRRPQGAGNPKRPFKGHPEAAPTIRGGLRQIDPKEEKLGR